MTEEEAKTKWCPMVRKTMWYDQVCLASGCMMWRWEPYGEWCIRLQDSKQSSPNMDMNERMILLPRNGYCGLGGKP